MVANRGSTEDLLEQERLHREEEIAEKERLHKEKLDMAAARRKAEKEELERQQPAMHHSESKYLIGLFPLLTVCSFVVKANTACAKLNGLVSNYL